MNITIFGTGYVISHQIDATGVQEWLGLGKKIYDAGALSNRFEHPNFRSIN